MALKSITGSKKLVQVMNRFGDSVNYDYLRNLKQQLLRPLRSGKRLVLRTN